MRVLIVHEHAAPVGGIERYLSVVVPGLLAAGATVTVWTERAAPSSWIPPEVLHSTTPQLTARPDVVFVHHAGAERRAVAASLRAPIVCMTHDYRGLCISGHKTWSAPHPVPCARPLGAGCIAHYYPHRCGGLSPLTMIRDYGVARREAASLRSCGAIVVLSHHMRDSLAASGVAPQHLHVLPPVVLPSIPAPRTPDAQVVRLLFVGRHVNLKGGHVLLDAVSTLTSALDRPLRLTFVGDGPDRPAWQAHAARLRDAEIRFAGQVRPDALDSVYASHDLLVIPSVWPEPFGLVGLEAGRYGVPSVAFAVGGIPEWLTHGVNGMLAADMTAGGLADAIVSALDVRRYSTLVAGTHAVAAAATVHRHVTALQAVLAQAATV